MDLIIKFKFLFSYRPHDLLVTDFLSQGGM